MPDPYRKIAEATPVLPKQKRYGKAVKLSIQIPQGQRIS
jgi:hypothetical protein